MGRVGGLFALAALCACSRPAPQQLLPPAAPSEHLERVERLERVESLAAASQLPRPRGRPLLVHFWALWCTACMEELPRQVELARTARARGIDVVFVNVDGFDKEAQVRAHLVGLGAQGLARHLLLDMRLEAEQVTRVFDPGWSGALPATFGYRTTGEQSFKALGPVPSGQDRVLLEAISP